MSISLLHIIVPTILVLAVLIFYIHSRTKGMRDEIGIIREQLEKLDNMPAKSHEKTGEKTAITVPVAEQEQPVERKDENDACTDDLTEVEASAYNTGKSGKIYTKEELELLIKE